MRRFYAGVLFLAAALVRADTRVTQTGSANGTIENTLTINNGAAANATYSETGVSWNSGSSVSYAMTNSGGGGLAVSVGGSVTTPSVYYGLDGGISSCSASTVGRMFYDAPNTTLAFCPDPQGGDSAITAQLNEEFLAPVRNTSGVTMPNGSVVYINGASGDVPVVSLADADTLDQSNIYGFLTQGCPNNQNCRVTRMGLIRGLDTSSFSANAKLYLSSTAGAYTTTAPTNGSCRTRIGTVIVSNASTGVITVQPPVTICPTTVNTIPPLTTMATSQVIGGGILPSGHGIVVTGAGGRISSAGNGGTAAFTFQYTDGTNTCTLTSSVACSAAANTNFRMTTSGSCAFGPGASLTVTVGTRGCTSSGASTYQIAVEGFDT